MYCSICSIIPINTVMVGRSASVSVHSGDTHHVRRATCRFGECIKEKDGAGKDL